MTGTPFSGIPESLRVDLLKAFSQIVRNFRERRWEPSELNGGKLCEVVYAILEGRINGRFPSKATKPKNMVDACRAFEKADPKLFSRSVRIQIPRMLITLYEIRNNRGVGHVGGALILIIWTREWFLSCQNGLWRSLYEYFIP